MESVRIQAVRPEQGPVGFEVLLLVQGPEPLLVQGLEPLLVQGPELNSGPEVLAPTQRVRACQKQQLLLRVVPGFQVQPVFQALPGRESQPAPV